MSTVFNLSNVVLLIKVEDVFVLIKTERKEKGLDVGHKIKLKAKGLVQLYLNCRSDRTSGLLDKS